MRPLTALSLFALTAGLALAAPPALDIPAEVKPSGQYVTFSPKTDAVSVLYVGRSGVDAVPSQLLKDGRVFLLDSRGLKAGRYEFTAVAAGKTGEQTRADFAVVVGSPLPPFPPLPPLPDDDKKKQPEPDPKPAPVTGPLFVVVVEETSRRTPETAAALGDLAFWGGLAARDVSWRLYDKDSADAARLGYLPHANKAGLPAALLLDRGGKVYDARRLTGTADVDAMLKGVGR